MDLNALFPPGLSREAAHTVEAQHSAAHIGSGSLRVLATPMMIAFMEANSHQLLAGRLPDGYFSVGTVVNVRHLAPTPLGAQVRIRSEVLEVDGLRITFAVQAWEGSELVGEGTHQRVVIDEARFLKRVASKGS